MLDSVTKSQILANRFAYEPDEQVLVPASALCEELIAAESLRRNYNKLVDQYNLLLELYQSSKKCPQYRHIDLRA